jgi:hypothetical protein
MARTTLNKQVTTSATINANTNSIIIDKEQFDYISFQAIWTGTPAGNFQLFGSNDYEGNRANIGTTTALVNASAVTGTTAAGGAAGSAFLPSPQTAVAAIQSYRLVQLQYSFTSSTGTLNTFFFGMGSGG